MKPLFTSSGYLRSGIVNCASGAVLELASLPPFVRVLLSTDGTVTKSIEAYFWEPIRVERVEQRTIQLAQDAPYIARRVGDPVLERRVQLVGENSQRHYVDANSLICVESLPATIRADLDAGRVGIGELLRECGLETYREILDLGYSAGARACVWRTYRIMMASQPFIQITERFPLAAFNGE